MTLLQPGPRAVHIYYCSRWAAQHGLRWVAVLLYNLNVTLHGCDISYRAEIAPGLKIVHPVGIVVGSGVRAGSDLRLGHGSTLGNRDGRERNGRTHPLLGSNITVNAGAAVLGPVTLGDGVVVGVNAVVLTDCEAGAVMVGIPARHLPKHVG